MFKIETSEREKGASTILEVNVNAVIETTELHEYVCKFLS
jgi:hypothetical protein